MTRHRVAESQGGKIGGEGREGKSRQSGWRRMRNRMSG